MEILDVIKYFSKFPASAGVLKNFKRSGSSIEGYSDLYNYVSSLTNPLMPEITELIVSSNEKEVMDRIRNIDNYFMFIEYGQLQGAFPDRVRIRKVSFNLAVYICYHDNSRGIDSMEEAVIMDSCLQKLFTLASFMIADDNEICPHTRFAESVLNFSPVEPVAMYGAIGWGLTFKKANNLVL